MLRAYQRMALYLHKILSLQIHVLKMARLGFPCRDLSLVRSHLRLHSGRCEDADTICKQTCIETGRASRE